jgi:FkbM family methyltransferase
MKRTDRFKLDFTRNGKLPGKHRLSNLLKPSGELKEMVNDGIAWLTGEDIAIYADSNSYIEWQILINGTYEDEINKLIRISLKPGENALDIGGNIGLQSIRMSQQAGASGTVLAFEPLTHLQERFKRNMDLNKCKNVRLLPYALALEEKTALFNADVKAWNQGAFSLRANNSTGGKEQRVVIKKGDNITEIQELVSLSLIKIDVEGFEYQVIQGLEATIRKHLPRIIFEYDANYWTATGQDIKECHRFLTNMGYMFFQITEVACLRISSAEQIVGGNLFCLPNAI